MCTEITTQLIKDSQLWDDLRAGNKSALKTIYDQEFQYLFNYGRKIFQRTELVEDSIHDLFVEIWQRHETVGPTDSIRRYLATSLRRKIVSTLKKESRSQSVDSFDMIPFDVELAIDEVIIAQELSEEQAMQLKKAFDKLTAKQKEILYLRFYQGLDYEQIAEVLGMKYQSLRNAVSRAIKNLRGDMVIILLALSHHVALTYDIL